MSLNGEGQTVTVSFLTVAPPERRHSGQHFPAFLWLSVRFQGERRSAERVTWHNDAPLPTHTSYLSPTRPRYVRWEWSWRLLFLCNVPAVGDTSQLHELVGVRVSASCYPVAKHRAICQLFELRLLIVERKGVATIN